MCDAVLKMLSEERNAMLARSKTFKRDLESLGVDIKETTIRSDLEGRWLKSKNSWRLIFDAREKDGRVFIHTRDGASEVPGRALKTISTREMERKHHVQGRENPAVQVLPKRR